MSMRGKRRGLLAVVAVMVVVAGGCATTLRHTPSAALNGVKASRPAKIMVADIGDVRGAGPAVIGFGFSYWLPITYSAEDESGAPLPVSHYLARSLSEDLAKVGYQSTLANQNRFPMTPEQATGAARKAAVDYLATLRVVDAKTNFWGYLFIPFVEPVKTRYNLDVDLADMTTSKHHSIRAQGKKTQWFFAKVTIFDAIFDAGIFGGWWHRTVWGKTVMSDALADLTQKIAEKAK